MKYCRDPGEATTDSSDSSSEKYGLICSIISDEEEIELVSVERDRPREPLKALLKGIGYGLDLRDLEGVRNAPEEAGNVSSWMSQVADKRG